MKYTEFINDIKKVNQPRKHTIKGSLGVYDAYKYIRKNKWYNIPRPLKEGEFYRIIRKVNQELGKALVRGYEIILPHRLGSLEILKRPSRIQIIDGKVVTNLPIDWEATLKLWYEDEESLNNKTLVHVENDEIFRVHYNKSRADYTNKTFYEFKPNRELKHALTKSAKQGTLEAYLAYRND